MILNSYFVNLIIMFNKIIPEIIYDSSFEIATVNTLRVCPERISSHFSF